MLIIAGGVGVWLRENVVPPGCDDPATLALVRQSLTGRFKLPTSTQIDDIQTLAGGYFAFRFVCKADLSGIDRHMLPPGTPVPGTVDYISRLTPDHQTHEVTVRIEPLLILERVQ